MNNQSEKITKYIFIGVCVAELLSRAFEWEAIHHVTKPLLMPVLLVYFRQGTTGRLTPSFLLAGLGLILSFIGDSMLLFEGELYFVLGLAAFAIAHIFYIVAFSKAVLPKTKSPSALSKMLYALPFLLLFGILMSALWPHVGELKIPVAVYAVIIIVMALSAVYRNGRAPQDSVNQVIFGAVLFLLSDSLLALDRFYMPMENAGVWIMSTYMLAQWNLINGLQKHYNSES
ncbi:lysoplasmalogenase [Reichenbachiella agarivorans]|uniref:Lysoplasmalogenase n=1 Tax=Reichenbachiella agarivorans TaxID=2979464 RepID=A0ABY6CP21_9BACT|nr:lysoplasmalogenase [Reichenbachiella agarivorans]UXP32282.1 lysoplasmalogenase [Reichenbachiella agarivorans]